MIIYILTILLFAISFSPKIRESDWFKGLGQKCSDFGFINSSLLIWIVIGFITRFDFSQMFGCVIYGEKILDYNNIGFASISFALILFSSLAKGRKSKITLVSIEIVIWLFRFFYYKGGYATGFTGNYPLDLIVLYDTVALLLRLKQIDILHPTRFLRKWRVFLIVILFVSVKIFILPVPHDLFWETKRIQKKTESTKSLLIGNWTGAVDYDRTWLDTIAKYRLDTISEDLKNYFEPGADRTQIDSTHKYAFKEMSKSILDTASISIEHNLIISPLSPDCKMDFNYFDWGDLIQNDSIHYGSFKISKLDNDSLIITITKGFGTDFKYKLVRKCRVGKGESHP